MLKSSLSGIGGALFAKG